MKRTMLKSKIHTPVITGLELYYEGSITIDQELMDKADILPGEQVQVVNLNNGARLYTYAISGVAGSKKVELNGPAARLGAVGDKIIILAYAQYSEKEVADLDPSVVLVDENNTPCP